jgi:glycosyltransferase involved in cell wall biosynthesis
MKPSTPRAEHEKPRILFVAYSFPPARTAGSVRTGNIARYLARAGWLVTVLTPDPNLLRSVERSHIVQAALERDGIRRLSTGHRWKCLAADYVKYPDAGVRWLMGGVCRRVSRRLHIDKSSGWVKPAIDASACLQPGDVDLILASGPSFTAFPLAQRLAQRLRCPYVLDYRDLWSRHLHNPAPWALEDERSAIEQCAAVTIVSPSWGSILEEQFGIGGKLRIVSNGYDPDDLAAVEPTRFGHFALVYTGSLWPPKRAISPLMAALRRLDDDPRTHDEKWMFHYYGSHQGHVLEEAERFGVTSRVAVHGTVTRATALSAVKGAGVAVVITSVETQASSGDNGMVTGKIFETIGLRTPTLLIAPPKSDATAVVDTSGLGRSFVADDIDGIVDFLGDLILGKSLEEKDPAAYAWDRLVRGLDGVLRKALQGRR